VITVAKLILNILTTFIIVVKKAVNTTSVDYVLFKNQIYSQRSSMSAHTSADLSEFLQISDVVGNALRIPLVASENVCLA